MINQKCKVLGDKVKRQAGIVFRKFKSKKTYREVTNKDVEIALACSSIWPAKISDEQQDMLSDRLVRLNEKQMHIIRLYYYEGKTQEEIACLFGRERCWTSRQIKKCLEIMKA